MSAIVHETVYPHPVERVWRAITDPESIAAWLMRNDFAPVVGHRFRFHTEPRPGFDGVVHCEVLEVDEPRRLVYSWVGGPLRTRVTWTLTPEGAGATRLRLEHEGFVGVKGFFIRSMLARGWKSKIMVTSIPRVLDRLAAAGAPTG
jgi:uncharacterized protein YndB with AHSA1/START domain